MKISWEMKKVHPRTCAAATSNNNSIEAADLKQNLTVLTVWKKSLLFNSDGFTVFDDHGNLVYRVENYVSGYDIILMDASGNSLLTIRRKKRSMSWLIYEKEDLDKPIFSVRKDTNFLNTKCLAHVRGQKIGDDDEVVYDMEGSFGQRSCAIYDGERKQVVEMKRKEASVKGVDLGMDIFTLVVDPGFDSTVAMAFVIVLDQMFGSTNFRGSRLLTYYS